MVSLISLTGGHSDVMLRDPDCCMLLISASLQVAWRMVLLWEMWSCLLGRKVTPRSSLESIERWVTPDLTRPSNTIGQSGLLHMWSFPIRPNNVCQYQLMYVHRKCTVLVYKTSVHCNAVGHCHLSPFFVPQYKRRSLFTAATVVFIVFSKGHLVSLSLGQFNSFSIDCFQI